MRVGAAFGLQDGCFVKELYIIKLIYETNKFAAIKTLASSVRKLGRVPVPMSESVRAAFV